MRALGDHFSGWTLFVCHDVGKSGHHTVQSLANLTRAYSISTKQQRSASVLVLDHPFGQAIVVAGGELLG